MANNLVKFPLHNGGSIYVVKDKVTKIEEIRYNGVPGGGYNPPIWSGR